MNSFAPKPIAGRTPLVLAALMLTAIGAFALVSRLVTRLKANEKQIAWHAYEAGLTEVKAGRPERALDDFRAALVYDPNNSEYQLNLARSLRDTGRLDESETYLLHLWTAAPQDSTISLALARLAVRRGSEDDAIRFYHNAIYGSWASNPDQNRQARFELIEFLQKQNAWPQARAELLAVSQVLGSDLEQHLKVAKLLAEARDYPNALAQYEFVLRTNNKDATALAGAGETAFQMGRYRSAKHYLQESATVNPEDAGTRERLQTAMLVLETDPFLRRISDVERNRRVAASFAQAGERLKGCAQARGVVLAPSASTSNAGNTASPLQSLWDRWQLARPQVRRLSEPSKADLPGNLMDLVFQIQQETAQECGDPSGRDLALLLISRDREAADQ